MRIRMRLLLGTLVGLAIVLGLMPGMSLTARAEDNVQPLYTCTKTNEVQEYKKSDPNFSTITKIEALVDMDSIGNDGWGQIQWGANSVDNHSVGLSNTSGIKKYTAEHEAISSATFAMVQTYNVSARLLGWVIYNSNGEELLNEGTMDVPEITAPTAKTGLTYTASEQDLVTAGTVTTGTGTLEYSLDQNEWSTDIPKAANAGSYTVYYRLKYGNDNNNIYIHLYRERMAFL